MVSYQVLQGVIRSGEISKKHSDKLLKIQRAMLMIEQDFTQIIARTSRDESKTSDEVRVLTVGKSLFESQDEGIEFTRLGWSNPLDLLPRSNLLRVRYRLMDGELQRLYFLYPDIVAGQEPEVQVLLTDIETLNFRFWNDGWKTSWDESNKLPRGIEIRFSSKQFGDLNRMFLIPESEVTKI